MKKNSMFFIPAVFALFLSFCILLLPVAAYQADCDQTGTMTILFLGSAYSTGNPPDGAEAIYVVKADFDKAVVNLSTLSRDLPVDAKILEDPAVTSAPLVEVFNAAYRKASGSNTEKRASASKVLNEVVNSQLGIKTEHYLTLDWDQITGMIDTIGGVEINIPSGFTSDRNVQFNAGVQKLNGTLAAEFVRTYEPGGESARYQRQKLFIQALQKQILSNTDLVSRLPTLLNQFRAAIVTDLTDDQLSSLICLVSSLPQGSIIF